jgi:hypothetical protein
MTNRGPLSIETTEWDHVAGYTDDDWSGGNDFARYDQARKQGELTMFSVRVKRHREAGHILVNALREDAHDDRNSKAGGYILKRPTEAAIVSAIRKVCENCTIPAHVGDRCIAKLPATPA